MNNQNIVFCVVAFLFGMFLSNIIKNVCGCKMVEGQCGTHLSGPETCTECTTLPGGSFYTGMQSLFSLVDHVTAGPCPPAVGRTPSTGVGGYISTGATGGM
jgi:hypothetical protein